MILSSVTGLRPRGFPSTSCSGASIRERGSLWITGFALWITHLAVLWITGFALWITHLSVLWITGFALWITLAVDFPALRAPAHLFVPAVLWRRQCRVTAHPAVPLIGMRLCRVC